MQEYTARSIAWKLQFWDEDEIQVCLITVVQLGVRAVPKRAPSLSPWPPGLEELSKTIKEGISAHPAKDAVTRPLAKETHLLARALPSSSDSPREH